MGRLLGRIKRLAQRRHNLEHAAEEVTEAAVAGVAVEVATSLLRRVGVRVAIFGAGIASAAVYSAVTGSPPVLSPATLPRYVAAAAPRYGLDPAAALAVSAQEGLGGGIGDQGTSFGPWQLHAGGSLPLRVYHGPYSQQTQRWAWSQTGINYALGLIAADGARGLHGYPSVNAIVRRFERPLRPGPEVAHAWAAYPAIARTLHAAPPRPRYLKHGWPRPVPRWCWRWASWRLGHGVYTGHAHDPRYRPTSAPHRIRVWWWRWFNHHWPRRHT